MRQSGVWSAMLRGCFGVVVLAIVAISAVLRPVSNAESALLQMATQTGLIVSRPSMSNVRLAAIDQESEAWFERTLGRRPADNSELHRFAISELNKRMVGSGAKSLVACVYFHDEQPGDAALALQFASLKASGVSVYLATGAPEDRYQNRILDASITGFGHTMGYRPSSDRPQTLDAFFALDMAMPSLPFAATTRWSRSFSTTSLGSVWEVSSMARHGLQLAFVTGEMPFAPHVRGVHVLQSPVRPPKADAVRLASMSVQELCATNVEAFRELVRNRVVVLGDAREGVDARLPLAGGELSPGFVRNASIIDARLAGEFVTRGPWVRLPGAVWLPLLRIVELLVVGGCVIVVLSQTRTRRAASFAGLVIVLTAAGSILLATLSSVAIIPVFVIFGAVLSLMSLAVIVRIESFVAKRPQTGVSPAAAPGGPQ